MERKNLRVFSSLILILFLGLLVPNIVGAEDANGSYTISAWNNTIIAGGLTYKNRSFKVNSNG